MIIGQCIIIGNINIIIGKCSINYTSVLKSFLQNSVFMVMLWWMSFRDIKYIVVPYFQL